MLIPWCDDSLDGVMPLQGEVNRRIDTAGELRSTQELMKRCRGGGEGYSLMKVRVGAGLLSV